ncbi:MAG: tetratricopeptide repeat protein [Candidatus Omnitrophica bacterium]|nr:tetratricopeptide repeat protein [Candidatus Omnitrophota bacterium]
MLQNKVSQKINRMVQYFEVLVSDRFLSFTVLFGFILLSHSNIFVNGFVHDDRPFILNWPLIRSWQNLPQFFVNYTPPDGQEGIYSPLKTLYHAISYRLFGLNPIGYHVVSLLVHFLGTVFVYKIILELSNRATAFAGALLFSLHPVHVEAITYITASLDTAGIVLLFASTYLFISAKQGDNVFHIRYGFSILLALLAVFSHELAISLPLLIVWYCLCFPRGKGWTDALKLSLPYFAIVIFYVIAKWLVLGEISRGNYVLGSFYLTSLIIVKAFAKYVLIALFPFTLSHNHVISKGIYSFATEDFDKYYVMTQSFFDLTTFSSLLLLVGLFSMAAWYMKKRPLLAFAVGWFFISLLPVANIIPSGVYFGERYLYPGLLGFVIIFAYSIFRLSEGKNKGLAFVIMAGFVLFYGIRTFARNPHWRDDVSMMESAVRANPKSALMRNDLGLAYTKSGKLKEALESFKEALAIKEDDPVIYFSQAEAFIQLNQYTKALESLNNAVKLDPNYAEAFYNLAGIYGLWDMKQEALLNLKLAINSYEKQGRAKEAEALKEAFFSFYKSIPQKDFY